MNIPALLATLALFALSTALGIAAVRKLIRIYEARHELRHGSAGFLRALSGWSWIGAWLLFTWLGATVLGDWYRSGELAGALQRAELRVIVIIEIASSLAEADH